MKDDVKDRLLRGDSFAAWDAAEHLRKNVRPEDMPFLAEAYDARSDFALRAEIVDIVGLIASQEACDFLTRVARSRSHDLVRYDAMRNLIELGCGEWRPASAQRLGTEFDASLLAYERYVRGEIELKALHTLARLHTKRSGDHWEWLLHVAERPAKPSSDRGKDAAGAPTPPASASTDEARPRG